MKKVIPLILALVMCLPLCAYGDGKATSTTEAPTTETQAPTTESTEATTEPIVILTVGETASTKVLEFTLDSFTFTDKLDASGDENYLTPIEENAHITLVPEKGETFVSFSFSIKNIGKEELSTLAFSTMKLVYSDGYTFEIDPNNHVVRTDDSYYTRNGMTGFFSPKVLAEALTYRGYFAVPLEVTENDDAPLLFAIELQMDEGPFAFGMRKEFIYELRP